MNKSDFVRTVKEVGGYAKKEDAEKALDSVVEAITQILQANGSVELVGFGKFENAVQRAKQGKVPGSDKVYHSPDKMVPKFKPGKALKDKIGEIRMRD